MQTAFNFFQPILFCDSALSPTARGQRDFTPLNSPFLADFTMFWLSRRWTGAASDGSGGKLNGMFVVEVEVGDVICMKCSTWFNNVLAQSQCQ